MFVMDGVDIHVALRSGKIFVHEMWMTSLNSLYLSAKKDLMSLFLQQTSSTIY